MNNKILYGIVLIILSMNLIIASEFGYNFDNSGSGKITITYINNTNSSDFWDNLDTPTDILGSAITNDLGWITSAGADSWVGNYSFYYNKTQIDNNFSLFYPISNPYNFINTTGDSWSTNYTFYYNKTQVDTNFSLYYLASIINQILSGNITDAKIYSNTILASNLTNYYNKSQVDYNMSLISSSDTWKGNYTFYYNKTLIDNNFSLYVPITNLYSNLSNYMLKNGSTIGTGNFNFGGYNISNIDNITVNKYCNSTNCYTLNNLLTTSSSTDTWSLNYSFYYNSTQVNSIVSSNDTWRTNYTAYYTGANVNSILGSNLSLTLLVNGSRIVTGNMNFGGYNISNIDNLTSNRICNSSTCYVLSDLLATTGDGSYNVTYHNYVIANISNLTYNWITPNGTTSSYNSTQLRNVGGVLTVLRDWWDTLYCKLTGCTMTGNLNLGGNNITNVGNISSNYYCNSTNCYTLLNFLTDTGGDTWGGNYTFYYNKTLVDNNFSLYTPVTSLYANLTNYMLANGSKIATGNFNFGNYNISGINNLTSNYICNTTNCYTLVQFLTDTTGGTDSWSLNYTFYYNKTQIDNNFSLYMSISSWNTNLTNIYTQINNNYTSSLTVCNANINNNLTQINTNMYSNLSNYILANGSRSLTGNWNVGGKNITNIDNITMTGKLSFGNGNYMQSNVTCIKIQGATSLLEIC